MTWPCHGLTRRAHVPRYRPEHEEKRTHAQGKEGDCCRQEEGGQVGGGRLPLRARPECVRPASAATRFWTNLFCCNQCEFEKLAAARRYSTQPAHSSRLELSHRKALPSQPAASISTLLYCFLINSRSCSTISTYRRSEQKRRHSRRGPTARTLRAARGCADAARAAES